MSNNNFKNRKYQTFISHAHVDKKIVEKIYSFLKKSAISVWYDSESLNISSGIASGLAKGIEECKSMIIIVSNDSLDSGWVEEERDFAIDQQKTNKEFKIIPIIIEKIDLKKLGFLKTKLFIEVFT